MFRSSIAFGVLIAFLPGAALSVPVPDEPAKNLPHVVVQAKPFDGLFDDYRKMHGRLKDLPDWSFAPDQLEQLLESVFPGWKKGLDKTKPWGGYFNFQANIKDSRFVLMMPVNDPKAYLANRGFLGGKIDEDMKTGIFSSDIWPIGPTFFRFHEGHIYVTFVDSKAIDNVKSLPKAAAIFIKEETAIVAVRLYIEGLPEEVKKAARDFFKDDIEKTRFGLPEMILMGMIGASDMADLSKRLVRLVDEGRWAVVRIELAEQLSFEFDLIARRGSALAREIADFKPRPSRLGGLLDDDTAIGLANSFGSFGGLKIDPKDMEEGITGLLKTIGLDGEAGTVAPLAKALVDSIRADEADLAVALKKAPGQETYCIVLAGKLNKAKALEAAIITYLKLLPAEKRKQFTKEAVKLENGAAVHKLSLPGLSDKAKALLGDGDLYFLFDDEAVFAAFGTGAVDRIKEAVKLTKKDGLRFLIQTDPTLLTGLVRSQSGEDRVKIWNSRFPIREKISLLNGEVKGGSVLQVKYKLDIVAFLKMTETFSRLW